MDSQVPEVMRRRVESLRWAAAAVLSGLLVSAGAVIWLVALIGDSVLVSLCAVGVMAAFVLVLFLFTDTFLMNATGARRLSPGEFAWLEPMVRDLAVRAGIEEPEVFISDQACLNAYTFGTGRRAKIVFFVGLLEELSRDEVRAVASHEIGHIVNKDVLFVLWSWAILAWVLFVGALASVVAFGLFGFAGGAASDSDDDFVGVLVRWIIAFVAALLAVMLIVVTFFWTTVARLAQLAVTRQREFLADATGAALTGQPDVLAAALVKVADTPAIPKGGNVVGRFCIMSPDIASHWWDGIFSTHPSPESRIKELKKLPPVAVSLAEEDWEGIGAAGLLLPIGTATLLVLVALIIPLL